MDATITIPLEPVESSNIAALGYDAERQILAVQFRSGALFHYGSVPIDLATELRGAPSKGTFFGQRIRHQFPGLKVSGLCPKCFDLGRHGAPCEDCGTATYDREIKAPSSRGIVSNK